MQTELYREIEVDLQIDDAVTLTALLDEGALPDLAGYYEVLYEEGKPSPDRTKIVLYFPASQEQGAVMTDILLESRKITDYSLHQTTVLQKDYLEAYKEYYRAFGVTDRLFIVPSWDRTEEKHKALIDSGKIPLYLDPGLAFGTGQHATTRLCLKFLEKNVTSGMKIVDAGCGSGILSIASVLFGAASVFAFDIDPNAVKASQYSVSLNENAAGKIETREGGFELLKEIPFSCDLLIGNLTKNTIQSNLVSLLECGIPRVVLSGILEEQTEEVRKMFSGWMEKSFETDDGWIVIEFARK